MKLKIPRSEDGLIVRGPLDLEDLILVGLETMQLQLQIPEIKWR